MPEIKIPLSGMSRQVMGFTALQQIRSLMRSPAEYRRLHRSAQKPKKPNRTKRKPSSDSQHIYSVPKTASSKKSHFITIVSNNNSEQNIIGYFRKKKTLVEN